MAKKLADEDLARLVIEEPQRVEAMLEQVKTLRVTCATQMVGLLGVTIYFGDSDGD